MRCTGDILFNQPYLPYIQLYYNYRLIWENSRNARLLPWGIVHHIDRNHKNNDPSNLKAMMRYEHKMLHNQLRNPSKHEPKNIVERIQHMKFYMIRKKMAKVSDLGVNYMRCKKT